MLQWALTFLILALVAAAFGFFGIAGDLAWIGKVLFVVKDGQLGTEIEAAEVPATVV